MRHWANEPRPGGHQNAESLACRWPGSRVLAEASMDEQAKWFGKTADIWFGVKNGERRGSQRLALEGQLTGTCVSDRDAPRPHVGRRGHPLPRQLLGRHERRRADGDLAGQASRGHAGNRRQPEVDHYWSVRPEEDVRGLEV